MHSQEINISNAKAGLKTELIGMSETKSQHELAFDDNSSISWHQTEINYTGEKALQLLKSEASKSQLSPSKRNLSCSGKKS